MVIYKPITILIFSIIFASTAAACSPSAPRLNQRGNGLFEEEAYLDALEAYEAAQFNSPELAEPYYNAANAFYRQGDFQKALSELQKALSYADQDSLRASGYFNMGNSSFNQQDLESAVSAYTQALLLDPHDMEAKYNLELALQQQSQQQEDHEEESDNQDQQQDNTEGEQGQDQPQQENEPSDAPQEQQDQSDSNSKDPSDQQQEGQNQDDSNSTDPDNGQEQDQPADSSRDQSQQAGDQGDGSQNPSAQIPQPGQRMTSEQAKQLLAAIAQNTQTLQEKIGQVLFVQAPPPVQDW
jgi:Ca-activated chloride channel family protein